MHIFIVLYYSDDKHDKSASNGINGQKLGSQTRGQSGGMSSLQGLPSLTGDRGTTGRKSRECFLINFFDGKTAFIVHGQDFHFLCFQLKFAKREPFEIH